MTVLRIMGCGRSKTTQCVTPDPNNTGDSKGKSTDHYPENGNQTSFGHQSATTTVLDNSSSNNSSSGLNDQKKLNSNGDVKTNGDPANERTSHFLLRDKQKQVPTLTKCSGSQTEFFRLLDERIEQGRDYESMRLSMISTT